MRCTLNGMCLSRRLLNFKYQFRSSPSVAVGTGLLGNFLVEAANAHRRMQTSFPACMGGLFIPDSHYFHLLLYCFFMQRFFGMVNTHVYIYLVYLHVLQHPRKKFGFFVGIINLSCSAAFRPLLHDEMTIDHMRANPIAAEVVVDAFVRPLSRRCILMYKVGKSYFQ